MRVLLGWDVFIFVTVPQLPIWMVMNITQTRPQSLVHSASALNRVAVIHDVSRIPDDSAACCQRNPHLFSHLSLVLCLQSRRCRRSRNRSGKERNAMRSHCTTWQVICSVALSCALNGIGVAVVILAILAWNNCVSAVGHDDLVPAHASESVS